MERIRVQARDCRLRHVRRAVVHRRVRFHLACYGRHHARRETLRSGAAWRGFLFRRALVPRIPGRGFFAENRMRMMRALAVILALVVPEFVVGAAAADLKPWTGAPLPAFVLKDLDGVEHRLADFQGKVVLVNFWATWCAPCRDEMPSIQDLRSQLKG